MKRLATVLPLALLAACVDDDTSTTTFSAFVTTFSTMSSPSTNATALDTWMPTEADETPTSGLDSNSTSETTGSDSNSSSVGSTTNDSETDGPVSSPPAGCAHFVEIGGRQTPEGRWIIVDASACDRADEIVVYFEGGQVPGTMTGIPANPCAILGGVESPAFQAKELPWVLVTIGDAVDPVVWAAVLFVNDVNSDSVRVPAILQGQEWPDAPEAPKGTVRRRADWSWGVLDAPIMSCDLLPV